MEAPDDVRGALIVVGDGAEALADLGKVGGIVRKKPLRRPRVRENGRQRLIDLVRQRHRQLPGERHAIEVRQRAPLLEDLHFTGLALGDVHVDPHHSRGPAVIVVQRLALR